MSTYTDASLIVTPNSKKAGKLYALKGADLDVVRAATATYVGSDGLIKTALANEVRLDYTNGSCPSILVEPQRTNLLLRSEEFDVFPWVTQRSTISTNTTISPTGNLTADTFNLSNVGQNVYSLNQTGITSSSLTNTFSIYVKYTNRRYIQLTWGSGFSTTNFANFDLITGTITGGTYLYAKINNSYDGFFRISITSTGLSTNAIPYIWPIDTFNAPRASTSNGIGSYILFGAQLEAGSNATSYIPTVASTVTRNSDTFRVSDISTNGFISNTNGTWFFELDNNIPYTRDGTSTGFFIDSSINAYTNGFNIRNHGGDNSRLILSKWYPLIGGNIVYTTTTDRVKMAIVWNGSTANVFCNGVKVVTNTAFVPTANMQYLSCINSVNVPMFIKSTLLFPTQLTDAQCISLTTL